MRKKSKCQKQLLFQDKLPQLTSSLLHKGVSIYILCSPLPATSLFYKSTLPSLSVYPSQQIFSVCLHSSSACVYVLKEKSFPSLLLKPLLKYNFTVIATISQNRFFTLILKFQNNIYTYIFCLRWIVVPLASV